MGTVRSDRDAFVTSTVVATDLDIRDLAFATDKVDASGSAVTVAGVSTAAKQDTLLAELQLKADLTDTQPVSIAGSVAVTNGAFATGANQASELTLIGAVIEAAPATDTASSGLNGRLQRIAQRITSLITALGSPFQAGGSIGNTAFQANAGTNLNTSALALDATLNSVKTAVEILDDWDETDRAKVNPIAGQAGVQGGSGGVTALTQRAVLATDVALPAGANAIGKLAANSGVDIGDVDVTSLPTSGGKTITYVSVNQTVAGTTVLAVADGTKKHKLMGGLIIMSLAGSLKFTDDGGDLTGPMDTAANGGFMASPSMIPLLQTGAINRALNLVTTVGAGRGVVAILTEP